VIHRNTAKQCKDLPVERVEADLLWLTDVVDRNVGEIWFAYTDPLVTKEELPNELMRLEQRGWVSQTTNDRWLTTEAGRTALAEARNWTITVRSVTEVPGSHGRYVITGALTAGSACFLDEYWSSFSIVRDDSESGAGRLRSSAETDVGSGNELLRLEVESQPIKAGDVLKYREVYV
jgi:hypothetical protein